MTADSRRAPGKVHRPTVAARRRKAYWLYFGFVVAALAASVLLVVLTAHAQSPAPGRPAAGMQAGNGPADPTVAEAAASGIAPRYSAKDIMRAFRFIDANDDGSISRQEAASFRNVARHFARADANQDNALSHEEFSNALNRP